MAYLSCLDHYMVFEEIASGRGYSDIALVPKPGSRNPALIIELKWDKSTDKAIEQIEKKQYLRMLDKFKYSGKVIMLGINYSTKTSKHTCKMYETKLKSSGALID